MKSAKRVQSKIDNFCFQSNLFKVLNCYSCDRAMTECLKSRRNAFDRNAEFEVYVDNAIEKLTSTEYFSLQPSF